MLCSRIVVLACALCCALPAGAFASQDKHVKGAYGVTTGKRAPHAAPAKGPYGTTTGARTPHAGLAKGPNGVTTGERAPHAALAKGPYGSTTAASRSSVATGTAQHRGAVDGGDADSWSVAAFFAASLFILMAVGSGRLVAVRRRAARVGV
jgi:hypothetical protein